MNKMIKNLPTVALRGMTILPSMIVHFDISREKSIKAVERAMVRDQRLFVIAQRDPEVDNPAQKDLYKIGTVVEIKQLIKLPKDILRVLVEGMEPAELLMLEEQDGMLTADIARIEPAETQELDECAVEAMVRNLQELFRHYAQLNGKMSKEFLNQAMECQDLERLVQQISINMPLFYEERQKILEAKDFYERYEILCMILNHEVSVLNIKAELQEKVKQRVDKNQKEYILREELKLIREELGEDTTVSDADMFREELENLKADAKVKEKIAKEIERFKSLGGNTSESSVARGYIETLLEMPWNKVSKDCKDIKKAREILEADHYGLDKVKERVLEFLAVRALTKKETARYFVL